MKYPGLILAATLAANTAIADTELTMAQSDGGDDASTTVISVQKGKVAFSEDGIVQSIYDSANGAFTQIDHAGKGYMVMDSESMGQMADQVSDMVKQFEAQMANMPPEQREAMMKMIPADMRAKLSGSAPKKTVSVEWTGDSDKVAGYKCKIASVTLPDGDRSTACVAKADALGIPGSDYDAMAAMLETMQELASRFGVAPDMPSAKQMGGVPIRMTGSEQAMELQSVSTDELSSAIFEVPAGYRKRSMLDGM
ncbi:MAG: DUF4412 domain-containing protein [Gammaproteobacteria bacterium]